MIEHTGRATGMLGIEGEQQELEAKRWTQAAEEARDRVLASGAAGAGAARDLGTTTFGRARRLINGVAEDVARRTRNDDNDDPEESDSTT